MKTKDDLLSWNYNIVSQNNYFLYKNYEKTLTKYCHSIYKITYFQIQQPFKDRLLNNLRYLGNIQRGLLIRLPHIKGRVGKNGETSSSALEFESTQPEEICLFLQTSLQSPSSNTHERAHDQWGHEISLCTTWKADRQVGHPVILAGPAKIIGRAFYSAMASTD